MPHDRPRLSATTRSKWLVFAKHIDLIGSDAYWHSARGCAQTSRTIELLMGNGILIIECAAHLDQLEASGSRCWCLRVHGLDSCPIRLIAIEDQQPGGHS